MTRQGTLCVDAVDAEVGMEVSVQQDFSPELNDNTSKAYVDFSNTFRNQVRGRGRDSRRGLSSHEAELGTLGVLGSRSSDVSLGSLAFQMQKVYQNVQGFKDVEILSLR